MLELHNLWRVAHGVPNVTWNSNSAAWAQAWSAACYWGHDDEGGVGPRLPCRAREGGGGLLAGCCSWATTTSPWPAACYLA